jgi:hypothetical protein
MGFTYTDKNPKVVLEAWGKFKGTLFETVVEGDMVSYYNTDNAYTFQFADQSDSQPAQAVALEPGVQGDTIEFAAVAILQTPVTLGDGGAATQQYFAAAADFFGAPLYLGESGKPSSSAGATYSQLVGYLLARDRIILQPNTALTGVAGSFTTLAASGVLSVTDATQATSTTAASMKTAGGLGVVKNAYIGGALDVAGAAVIDGTLSMIGTIPITDPGDAGAIPVLVGGYCLLVTGGAETRTLAIPTARGQMLELIFKTDGGDCVVTAAAAINQAGNTIMTFADGGDHILLQAGEDGAGAMEWRVVANDGVALS